PSEIQRRVPSVAVLDDREEAVPVVGRFERRLGDLRELPAEDVRVAVGRLAEPVVVDLLVEVEVPRRTLPGSGVARVDETRAVGTPGDVAAGRSSIDSRDDVRPVS